MTIHTYGGSSRALNLAALMKSTRMVGPGARDGVWVQGCRIRCPGCMNRAYQPHVKRVITPVNRLIDHFSVRTGRIQGCSVLGGEPTEQADAVADLLCGVRSLGLSTVLFTGRLIEDLERNKCFTRLLEYTDLLIDGPFIAELRRPDLHYIGSTNQRFHFLSGRYSLDDIPGDEANAEIRMAANGVIFHGVGMADLMPYDF